MSLRKSPTLSPAFVAANRANAAKSTGPRTDGGKRTSAMNGLRSGFYSRAVWMGEPSGAREHEAFESLCQALRIALMSAETEAGDRAVRNSALKIWRAKWVLDRWIEWEARECRAARERREPMRLPYRMPAHRITIIQRPSTHGCPGWTIKVSIRERWGRSAVFLRLGDMPGDTGIESAFAAWREWRTERRRAHTVIILTCIGHPWTRRYRQRLRVNPQGDRRSVARKRSVRSSDEDTSHGARPAGHDQSLSGVRNESRGQEQAREAIQ